MIRVTGARLAQLRYIGITDEDMSFLKSKHNEFAKITNAVVDELYNKITLQPELVKLIEEHSTIDRLKETQRWYFQSMTAGLIDDQFIEKRIFIGKVHSRIGLTTNWYLGTYILYLDIATAHFKRIAPDDWANIVHSLTKMFNFDSQLVLEAYESDEKAKIEQLVDQQQEILRGISAAIQDLVALIADLNRSSEAVASTAIQTAESQDKSHNHLIELNKEIKDVHQIGTFMRDMSDQTHLLSLNAALEAARAGDAGRGFEVVANEVRKLAAGSKDSLKNIQQKLKKITDVLALVQNESEQTSVYSREQAASSEELASFVHMIQNVTEQLEVLKQSH
ncbi:protoglobin domain-containing protein [Cohnella faecalis]|uniref:Chemotaxis protein n=1 Tax=Cohnella faecalis TaxID=2315694 RepID=A0A398CUV1_9BACL|nr:globin-coupled sensor protein [Cohnella faecalis]RIE02784.1 chemotaxis protein [Cohnella faecalis]